jgi:biotin transporter BioY
MTLAVSLSLVPVLDAQGAAIATVAAELTLAAVSAAALSRAQPQLRLPFGIVPIALAAGGVALGAGWLLGIHPVIDASVATAVYALLLAAAGRFPPEVSHMIRAQRHPRPAG